MDISILSELIANIVSFIFSFFSKVDLSPIADAISFLKPYLQAALYILPAKTIGEIFAVICSIWSLRLVIKTLRTLWDIIPLL